MTNIPPLNAAEVLRRHGLRPEKKLGQNFLQDDTALRKIAEAAEITPGDVVLEIGPGLGSLTRYLADSAKQVIAVELDTDLIPALKTVLAPWKNVTIIQGDILSFNIPEIIPAASYLAVANIPYYITSAIIRHLVESTPRPARIVLTMQKEVAERICAKPGDLSLLALSVQVYGEPEIAAKIPAEAFYPQPKVDSAILKINLYPASLIPPELIEHFFRLAKAGFSQKRKTLRNSLSGGLAISPPVAASLLEQAHIDPQRRAETISIAEWHELSKIYANSIQKK